MGFGYHLFGLDDRNVANGHGSQINAIMQGAIAFDGLVGLGGLKR